MQLLRLFDVVLQQSIRCEFAAGCDIGIDRADMIGEGFRRLATVGRGGNRTSFVRVRADARGLVLLLASDHDARLLVPDH